MTWVQPTVSQMRENALDRVEEATGGRPLRAGRSNVETYQAVTGAVFHLRTRYRDPMPGGGVRYYFGLREACWVDGEYFVLACDLDFVLVVPVDDWLPYQALFSLSGDSRQPHIVWTPSKDEIELREGLFRMDMRPYRDRFDPLI